MITAAGVRDALVNAGGDLRATGSRGERPWRIGIQAPRGEGELGVIALADGEAAFTSGDYERFRDENGHRLHHLLDPLTGRPAEHTQAVTVIADNGTLADAAATAIFVAGPERWREVAKALGVALALRVDSDGQVSMTDAMRTRIMSAGNDLTAAGRS
jgi:thiamine biosynthesis lipoprotein